MDIGTLPTGVIIPRDATLLEIRDSYGPLADEVRCGLEGCRTPHKRGFTVAFSVPVDGAEGVGIVGHVCGKNAFGTGWIEAERVYDAKLRAAEADSARERFIARAGRILPELGAVRPRLQKLNAARRAIEKHAAVVMKICSDAVRTSHGLIKIGDHTLHHLEGKPFWIDVSNTLLRTLALDADATRFLEYLSSPDATRKEIGRRLEAFNDIEHRWGEATRAMAAAGAALRPSHLREVLKAVNLIESFRPHPLGPGYDRGDTWQLYVRIRGTVLEVQQWGLVSDVTRNWHPTVDLS